ncbi:MAG TPA: nuclear transport factor 2 family protein [Solirubrobacterales bacterium]
MASSDIDVVRDQFGAVNERDFARAMNHYADDVVLVVPGEGLQSGTFEGKQAVGEWFGDWFRTFDRDYRFEVKEARELRDGLIYLLAEHGGRGRLSGAEVQGENAYLYRVRDGKVFRVGFFASRDEALEAASLSEWSGGETD